MSALYNVSFRYVDGKRQLCRVEILELNQSLTQEKIISEHVEQSGIHTYTIALHSYEHNVLSSKLQDLLEVEVQVRESVK